MKALIKPFRKHTRQTVLTIFFTSDLHFGHRNITRYCNRPFPDTDEGVGEMNAGLVKRWNSVVRPKDVIFVIGDFAMGNVKDNLQLLSVLNGSKRLVAGNHDRCWKHGKWKEEKIASWRKEYLKAGFDSIEMDARITIRDKTIHMNHFPFTGDSHGGDRYEHARPKDRGQWLVHGHIHNLWRQKGRQINVGIDAWGGIPVSEFQLVELIEAGPRNLEVLEW